MKFRNLLKGPNVNKVVKYFVFADLMLWAGWGFVGPIFAIFVIEDIVGTTLVTVGTSAAVYWFTRSLVQPPIAIYLDRKRGERDDLYVLIAGLLLASFSAFLFALISTVFQLYVVQFVHGIAMGAYSVSWSAIFSRHLDKGRFAFDWSLDRAAIGAAVGASGILGGVLANSFGFDTTFVITGILAFLSALIV